MGRLILLISNFILYSNIWIAIAALCLSIQTQYIFTGSLQFQAYHGLLFFGTIALYAVHRLIGMKKILSITQEGRFAIIRELELPVLILAVISGLVSLFFVFQLPIHLNLWMLPAGLISATYVLPILRHKQRLRDINYVKIFLIAIVWSWLTAFIPALWIHQEDFWGILAISMERFFFIFAITLPFDIRDLKIDTATKVKTLPSSIGIKATKYLAYLCLLLMISFSIWSFYLNEYSMGHLTGLFLCALVCFFLIKYSSPERPDFYYTGFLDGTMILQLLLVLFGMYLETTSLLF